MKLEQEVKRLRKAESGYRNLVSRLPIGVYRSTPGPTGRFIMANETIASMFGYASPEAFIQTKVSDLYMDPAERVNFSNELLSQGEVHGAVLHLRRSDGTPFWASVSARVVRSDQGEIEYFDGIIDDITEAKLAEKRLRENEAKYRTLFHQFGAGIYLHDRQGRIVDVNQAACQQTGYAKDELLQLEIFDLHPEEPETGHPSREEILRQWHRWKPEERFILEAAHKRKDGSVFPIELSASVMHYGGKHFIIAIVQDITDRKQAEKARRESERFLEQVFEAIQDGISVLDTDFNVIKTNRWMEQMYASSGPLVGNKCYQVYQQLSSPCSWCPTRKTVETGETKTEVVPYPTHGNPSGWIELSAFPVKSKSGAVVRVIEYVKDITQRRAAEKELRDLNETMDLAQKMAGVGYWSYDIEKDKRFWSTQMYENFGLDPALGPPRMEDIQEVFHPEDRDRYERNFADAIRGTPYDQIARILIPNGDIHYVRTQGYPRKNEAGDIVSLFGTSQDITERVMSEKALRESEENYRRIFENSVVGFFQSTPEGRFTRVNTAFAKMLRYESPEALLAEITDIETQYYVNVADRRRYQKILQEQGYVESYEVKVKRKDGSQMWVSSSTRAYFNEQGKVLRYEGINVDITHRKKAKKEKEALQAQLQQAQKFEAIGTLAGGIAHDFNNLLMGIQGRASLMAAGLEAHHPLMEHIQGIEAYVQNAADLTKQMLGFARGGKYEVKPVDINEMVAASAAMFGRTRKEIRIH
ncbi:MAG: PAS domain S-box protein, partial [Desulfobacteraceae bacterium]|nr:PAS domain S-box protein [Desulfobacteraceae bacterium]